MKKITTFLTLTILTTVILTSCAQNEKTDTTSKPSSSNAEEVSTTDTQKITFETTDINGNAVTDEIFKDYDLTMINVWGTGCVPCIEEMPGLSKFYDSLPSNVNMISICVDYETDPSFANEVLEKSNANFTTLKVSESLFEGILLKAQALPTTLFIDSEGNIVGDVVLGAPAVETDEKVVEHYTNYVNERLGVLSET